MSSVTHPNDQHRRGGRPSTYTPELADAICDRLAHGESLVRIVADEAMPGYRTVMRWLDGDGLPEPEAARFRHNYARARADGADHEFEAITDLEQRILAGEVNLNAGRVVLDSMRWRLARKAPRKYGDRSTLELQGPDGGPVDAMDPTAILMDLRRAGLDVRADGDALVLKPPGGCPPT